MAPKSHCLIGIEDICERLLMDVAQGPMKEAGAHGPIRLDDGRDPGRIADNPGKLALRGMDQKPQVTLGSMGWLSGRGAGPLAYHNNYRG
jgi:hypothetical protein